MKETIKAAIKETTETDIMEGYEPMTAESLGGVINDWTVCSRALATIRERIRMRHVLEGMATEEEKGRYVQEAKDLEKEFASTFRQLESYTRRAADLFAEDEAVRGTVANWTAMQKNMRMLLVKELRRRKVELNGVIEKAEALEAEQIARLKA